MNDQSKSISGAPSGAVREPKATGAEETGFTITVHTADGVTVSVTETASWEGETNTRFLEDGFRIERPSEEWTFFPYSNILAIERRAVDTEERAAQPATTPGSGSGGSSDGDQT